jgi:hypothetical protein
MSAEPIDSKLSRLEGAFDRFQKRFDLFELAIMNRFDAIDKPFDVLTQKADANFRWTIGVMLTSLVTLFSRIH